METGIKLLEYLPAKMKYNYDFGDNWQHYIEKEWAEKFKYEAELIADLTGIEKAKIRHIGSTSVPGMIAKPILDIMIEVNKIDDIIKLIPSLDEIGYRFFGECGRPGRMFFTICIHPLVRK